MKSTAKGGDQALYRSSIGGSTSYARQWVIGDGMWELKFSQKLPGHALGYCDPGIDTFYIRYKQTRIETFRTFIHEAIHAMEAENDFSLPHKWVEKLEIPLADFLIENKEQLCAILFP